jgi:hypothetical protein
MTDLQLPNGDFLKSYPEAGRVEIITNNGQEYVCGGRNIVVGLQDNGQTIKVFFTHD